MGENAVCSICSMQTACLGGQIRYSGRMTGDDGDCGWQKGLQWSVPIITKKAAASNRFTRRRWMQQADSARGSDGSRVGEGWQVKGWMAGSKGAARFAPARSQGSCKADWGWRRSDGWGLSTPGSSSVAGRGGRAYGGGQMRRRVLRREREVMDYRASTQQTQQTTVCEPGCEEALHGAAKGDALRPKEAGAMLRGRRRQSLAQLRLHLWTGRGPPCTLPGAV